MNYIFRKLSKKNLSILTSIQVLGLKNEFKLVYNVKAEFDQLKISQNIKLYGHYSMLDYLSKKYVDQELNDSDLLYTICHQMKSTDFNLVIFKQKIGDKQYITSEKLLPIDVALYFRLKKLNYNQNQLEPIKEWYDRVDDVISKIHQELQEKYKVKEVVQKKVQKTAEEKQKEKESWAAKEKKQVVDKNLLLDPEYLKTFNKQKVVRTNKGEKVFYQEGRDNRMISSALPYVNNSPHLGNIIGCVLSADVYARYCRLRGYNTMYICGTDEYGTATEIKAKQEKSTPNEICAKYWQIQKDVFEYFDIDFDYFGRTSTKQQTKITHQIFNALNQNGLISEATTEQQYCDQCEQFLPDRYINGTCPECGYQKSNGDQCDKCGVCLQPGALLDPYCTICNTNSQKRTTTHLYLNLDDEQKNLQPWLLKQMEEGFWTENTCHTVKNWLNKKLQKRCITRDLKWGTSVPQKGYENKVFYVWFDAPIGYISITASFLDEQDTDSLNWEKWWKNDEKVKYYSFMGKDNIPFHSIIFPSSLMASKLGFTMVTHINSTEYLNYEGGKFSKSNSTGVFGSDLFNININIEVWRYYLLINRPEKSDSEFSWDDFQKKNNNELKNNIGNFCHRTLKYLQKKASDFQLDFQTCAFTQDYQTQDIEFIKQTEILFNQYIQESEAVEISKTLKTTMKISSLGNGYIQNLVLEKLDKERFKTILNLLINMIRFYSLLFEPFLPSMSAKINFLIGMSKRTAKDDVLLGEFIKDMEQNSFNQALINLVPENTQIQKDLPTIFREITNEEIEELRNKFNGNKEVAK